MSECAFDWTNEDVDEALRRMRLRIFKSKNSESKGIRKMKVKSESEGEK